MMNVAEALYVIDLLHKIDEGAAFLFVIVVVVAFVSVMLVTDMHTDPDGESYKFGIKTLKSAVVVLVVCVTVATVIPSKQTMLAMYAAPIIEEHGLVVFDKVMDRLEKLLKEKK